MKEKIGSPAYVSENLPEGNDFELWDITGGQKSDVSCLSLKSLLNMTNNIAGDIVLLGLTYQLEHVPVRGISMINSKQHQLWQSMRTNDKADYERFQKRNPTESKRL